MDCSDRGDHTGNSFGHSEGVYCLFVSFLCFVSYRWREKVLIEVLRFQIVLDRNAEKRRKSQRALDLLPGGGSP
jgi:hypothetical protein